MTLLHQDDVTTSGWRYYIRMALLHQLAFNTVRHPESSAAA
ncbi:hypothetical protein [Legionella jamestowniensis]|nr:hypothetical protein [Legionella jamestowniensis]